MSAKSPGASYPQNRTDTLIGEGVRVDGSLMFTGVLRIQGVVLGDVSCDRDPIGTVVVGKSGSVTGAIEAPYIVVGGRVSGPLHSSASIVIQQGAHVTGDAFYQMIDIHAGGIIEGSLTAMAAVDRDRLQPDQGIQTRGLPAARDYQMPLANPGVADGTLVEFVGGRRTFARAIALMIAVVALVVVSRYPESIALPAVDVLLKANSAATELAAAPSEPGRGAPRGAAEAAAGDAAPLAPNAKPDTKDLVATPRSGLPELIPEDLVLVHGVNPGRPAGVFSVSGKEPAVLFRKQRQDSADGARIDVSQDATAIIAIGKNEIFRVAQGKNLEIFYQGRKVAPKTIESGAWMSFVPLLPGGASDRK